MKTTLLLLLTVACLYLFYAWKQTSQQFAEQQAAFVDLTSRLDAEKQAHAADSAKLRTAEEAIARAELLAHAATPSPIVPAPPVQPAPQAPPQPPLAVAPPAATPVAPAASRTPLEDFAAVMRKDIETSPPPFVIFMDTALARRDADMASEQEGGYQQLSGVRKVAIDRFNGFLLHVFPGRPDLRMMPRERGGPENASSGVVGLSPAKLLWLAADDSSPDAKYAVRWLKLTPRQLTVAQEAMETLDRQITPRTDAASAALARSLHDARTSLKNLIDSKQIEKEDQRKLAFFLRSAGVPK